MVSVEIVAPVVLFTFKNDFYYKWTILLSVLELTKRDRDRLRHFRAQSYKKLIRLFFAIAQLTLQKYVPKLVYEIKDKTYLT